jgi:hypothetical protein
MSNGNNKPLIKFVYYLTLKAKLNLTSMKKHLPIFLLFLFVIVFIQISNAQNYVNVTELSGSTTLAQQSTHFSDSLNFSEQNSSFLNTDFNKLNPRFQSKITDQSQAIRDEWLKRGGKISYVSFMLTGVYFNMDMGTLGKMNGYGGGYSFYVNKLNLKIPEYKSGQSNWNSLNWGFGLDFVTYGFSTPKTLGMETKIRIVDIMVAGNIGWTLGLGKYIDQGNWKGVALTIKYRPSYNFTMTGMTLKSTPANPMIDGTSTDVSGKFNAGGFGFDIDFASYSATMNKLVPKPKSKISFFFLPPIGGKPLYLSFSYGVVIFPRAYTYKRIRL